MLNAGEIKTHDYCSSCMFYLGAIAVNIVAQALAGVVSAALVGSFPDIAKNGDFNTAFMIVIQVLTGLYIFLYNKLLRRKFNFVVFNEGQKTRPHFTAFVVPVAAAVVLMCGMFLPTMWYGYFTQYLLNISPEVGQIDLSTPSSVVMIVIASVFLAPICEETVYRGVLFNGLKSEFSAVKAAMLSALAFMLMHMSPAQVVFQFALGVLSAFIMYKTGRLVSCIILHASANALALVIELTPFGGVLSSCVEWLTRNIAAAVFITLALFVAAGAILFVLVRFCIKGRAEPKADEQNMSPERLAAYEATAALRRKDGTFRYIVAATICGVLFIINTVVGIVS